MRKFSLDLWGVVGYTRYQLPGELIALATGLLGSTRRNLDDKDRLALVTSHTDRLTGEVILVAGADRCIEIHSQDESWDQYQQQLTEAADGQPEEAAFARHVLGSVQKARPDGQGRVRIDGELLRWAKIPAEPSEEPRVVLIRGAGNRVELWNPAVYDEHLEPFEPSFPAIRGRLRRGGASQPGSESHEAQQ